MYKTSTDYGRLWELIQPNEEERENAGTIAIPKSGILWRSTFGKSEEFATPWSVCPKAATRWTKEGFISDCKKQRLEFIDPASQQKTPAELAAGEMAGVLQWALDAMPPSSFDPEHVHHYCVALAEKAEEILNKAKGLKS